jgi:hypothetical protein
MMSPSMMSFGQLPATNIDKGTAVSTVSLSDFRTIQVLVTLWYHPFIYTSTQPFIDAEP